MKQLLYQPTGWKQLLIKFLLTVAIVILAVPTVALPAWATAVYDVPPLSPDTWIVDQAEVISRANENKINTQLKELAEQSGFEARLVTIHRLDYGETAQSFTDQLFETWFPTPEAQAHQVVLVLDNLTNNVGIRAGDEVKAVMPDAIAQSVAQETVLIPLKEDNKYNQALLGASDRLTAVLSGEPDPGPPELKENIQIEGTFATPEETKSSNATFWVITFLIVATVVPMATYYFYQFMQSR